MNINTWRTPGKADILKNCHPSPRDTMTSSSPHRGCVAREFGSGTQFRKVKEVVLKPSWRTQRYLWHTGHTGHDFHGKHLQIAPTQVTLWILFVAFSKILAPESTSWKMEDVVVHPLCIEVCQGLQVVTPTAHKVNMLNELLVPHEIHIDPCCGLLWSS